MATSSITKQFVVKDEKAFEKLMQDVKQASAPKVNSAPSSLDKGREALARFLLR